VRYPQKYRLCHLVREKNHDPFGRISFEAIFPGEVELLDGDSVRHTMRKADHALATVRISSQTLSAAAMGNTLAVKATRSYEKGESVNQRNLDNKVRQESACFLESSADPSQSLDIHIYEMISFLENHLVPLEKLAKDCKIDIVCGLFSENMRGNFWLDSKMIKRIAAFAFEVEIVFDVYMGLTDV
jgi:hypothetical protein